MNDTPKQKRGLAASAVILSALLNSTAFAQQTTDAVAPEAATTGALDKLSERAEAALVKRDAGQPVVASDWMVSAANPLAVEAGARVLSKGGTAADAMVAVQSVLGLVEPQSSGLGGGAFLVWFDAETGELTTLDGRETAPIEVNPRLFQDADGEKRGFYDAAIGGISVGVPGTPALMEDAHRRWGSANWPSLFEDAIDLAENGFTVTPRLAGMIEWDAERLSQVPSTAAYFMPDGVGLQVGDHLQNQAYGQTLRSFAVEGADAFYTGEIAEDIVATVRGAVRNPGVLSMPDMANYRVVERPAVCATYRSFEVCGMGPPSSGGLSVGQILGHLQPYDIAAMGPESPEAWRLIGDSSRLAFADRGRYIADSDFVPVPVGGLLDETYLKDRASLLEGPAALDTVSPGQPEFDHALLWADNIDMSMPSTSHISIVDRYGNVLSMTTTIETGFGSHLMTKGGFLLNNELTDFSFATHSDGVPIANAVAPGKRPRSSMAPTIVMQDGEPVLAVGSPGGSRIIGYVAKAIISVLDWDMDVQSAAAAPHLINRFGTYDLEEGTDAESLAPALEEMGFETNSRALTSGLHMIKISPTGLEGGADPRREGIALGE